MSNDNSFEKISFKRIVGISRIRVQNFGFGTNVPPDKLAKKGHEQIEYMAFRLKT